MSNVTSILPLVGVKQAILERVAAATDHEALDTICTETEGLPLPDAILIDLDNAIFAKRRVIIRREQKR